MVRWQSHIQRSNMQNSPTQFPSFKRRSPAEIPHTFYNTITILRSWTVALKHRQKKKGMIRNRYWNGYNQIPHSDQNMKRKRNATTEDNIKFKTAQVESHKDNFFKANDHQATWLSLTQSQQKSKTNRKQTNNNSRSICVTTRQNVSSEVSDKARHKPACAATKAN